MNEIYRNDIELFPIPAHLTTIKSMLYNNAQTVRKAKRIVDDLGDLVSIDEDGQTIVHGQFSPSQMRAIAIMADFHMMVKAGNYYGPRPEDYP
jgi:hypothetical protein